MTMMDWIAFGWRDGILLMAALAAVYLVVLLLRLTQVGRRRPARIESETPPIPAIEAEVPVSTPTTEWNAVQELLGESAQAAAPVARPAGFGEHLAEHLARSDMEMEVQRMRAEIERMRTEMEELRAARRVSPQYAEAMELAQRGFSAQAVADRLGISLAEAELVHALSRGDQNFEEGDEHGADEYVASDGRNEFGERRTG